MKAQSIAPVGADLSRPKAGTIDCTSALLTLLRHLTIASKEAVVRRYDHEVQGATVLKPLVGKNGNGPGDATVLRPILDEPSKAGIVIANGINPLYGAFDPYHMALTAVDEALRNLTAVGGDITRAAILDNFCWGNPADPAQLGMLVRAVKGCHDAAVGFGVPFISGKDSLNNEYRDGDTRLPVMPTLLISAIGIIDDAARTVDMSLKSPGNLLYLVGTTREEMAGSHATLVGEQFIPPAAAVPRVDTAHARATMQAIGSTIRAGLVSSCHDLSEGGLAVAAAEMAMAGQLGLDIDLAKVIVPDRDHYSDEMLSTIALFSESPSRFLVEIIPEQRYHFEAHMQAKHVKDISCIGTITQRRRLLVRNHHETLISLTIDELEEAWKGEQA